MAAAELKLKLGVETTLVEKVTIEVGDSKIIVPRERIAQALLRDMFGQPKADAASGKFPKIGQRWQGGTYAGLMRGTEGAPDYHLVHADHPEVVDVTWEKAKEWAASLRSNENGEEISDYTLPNRREQRLLWANLPERFQSEWYWSSEQHASDAVCAWMQYFGYGDQANVLKGNAFRARAVRRIDLTL